MTPKPRPRRALLPTLVIVAFFAALPAWFLSTLEGWVSIDCRRVDALQVCDVHERFAFGTRDATHTAASARVITHEHRGRRGTSHTYQLQISEPHGPIEVLRTPTGNDDLVKVARDLAAAIETHAPTFHASVAPDDTFWLAVAVLGVFVAAGVFVSRPR